MNEIILNYIVQAVLGGASGYITNDYAINMLFKEYTPFKIGGVIKKTRTEFVENISSMIENDIISTEKLRGILSDESFKKEFEALTADFYERSLYETADSRTFSHIDGFEQTIEASGNFAFGIINEHMPRLYEVMASKLSINDFLSAKQLDKISESLYSVITEIFTSSPIAEDMLLSIYSNNDKLVVGDFLDKNRYRTVISNAGRIFTEAVSELGNTEIEKVLSSTGLDNALNSSKEVFYSRSLKEVIHPDSDVLKSINNGLLSYVNSGSLSIILNSLFSYGMECDKSIIQLLDSSFGENLKQHLIKIIPSATENAVDFINANSVSIDRMIDESIDETIKDSDGWKARLLSAAKNAYFSGLSRKYGITEKIISYVKRAAEPEKLSSSLSAQLTGALSGLNVAEIVAKAEGSNITPESSGKLIINYVNNNSESIIGKISDWISEIKIKQMTQIFDLVSVAYPKTHMRGKQILPDNFAGDVQKNSITGKLKKLVASSAAQNYLTEKTAGYADRMLSKEFGRLIGKEKAAELALKIKNFIGEKLKNKEPVKKWIANQITAAAKKYSGKEPGPEAVRQLNEEIYKNYGEMASKLKEVPLSALPDKLNSIENLAGNSSGFLRSYAVKNADAMLRGSVKAIVTDNLNKLSDNELVDFANDFIGRELKPIMYFGGVLGVAAGIILAAFQSSPVAPAEVNAVNMAVYAFVGYITNVIAINMLFRPYKEKKLLARIPFLRNFSLGYIVKNQKIFAENTAHFIDSSLLSKKSINELFDKYRDNIKLSFTKGIAGSNYKALSSLLSGNKDGIVEGIYASLKNKAPDNLNNVGCHLYGKINNIRVSSLINEEAADKISSALVSKLQSPETGSEIYSLIDSGITLESIITGNSVRDFISGAGNSFCDKLCAVLSGSSELSSFILKYEESYQSITDKKISEIISSEKREQLARWTADKIIGIVLSQDSRNKIIHKALSPANRPSFGNKTVEEIFGVKFKGYMDSLVPKAVENISGLVITALEENRSKIAVIVQSEIKGRLGIMKKGIYTLMDGDKMVDEVLDRLITVKVPKFLDSKTQELYDIIYGLLDEGLYKAKADALYTGLNELQLTELVDDYLGRKNPIEIKNSITGLTEELFLKAGSVRLSSILKLINMDTLSGLANAYGDEINAFGSELSASLRNNKKQIEENLSGLACTLTGKLMKTELKEILKGIPEEDIKRAAGRASGLISGDSARIIRSSLKSCKDYLSINAGEFIDKDEFIKSAGNYFMSLLKDREFETAVKEHLGSLIDEAVSTDFGFLDDETKKYSVNMFTDTLIGSLRKNLDEILKAVEFDKIALKEIEKMEPEKIHEMFNSFGEKYFRRLMLYGFGGFVFGINVYIGLSLALLKIISELSKNKNDRK